MAEKKDYGELDAVQEAMGVMGPWQIIIALSLALVNFPVAWQQLANVFIAAKQDYTCADASPDNVTMWPKNECYMFVNSTSASNTTISSKVICKTFNYSKISMGSSIVNEWDLVCDRAYLTDVLQGLLMAGILVGNMGFGAMADRIGRKIPLMIAVVVQSIAAVAGAYVPWFPLYVVLKVISAAATGGTMLISFVLVMEIVGVEWRSTLSVLFHIPFLLGHLSIPLIAYLTETWSLFSLVTALPAFGLLSYYWLVPESPRWLLAVGKINKAKRVLNAAAKRNSISEEKVTAAIDSHLNQSGKETETDLDSSKTYSILDLFRTPNMRIRTICIAVNWLVCGLCFFGLSHFAGVLPGDTFVNVAVSATCELPGLFLVLYLISRVSRLKILMCSNVTAGVCLIILALVDNGTLKLILLTIGISAMSISYPIIYLYTGELFPTVMRNVGFGVCSVASRCGSIVAPFVVSVGPQIPPLIFGIGPLIGAGLCVLLPETMNCKLPETIEEAENFRKEKRNSTRATAN